ncbi:MAG: ABC transporter permease [Planctomycetota bacterium]
MSTVPGPSPIIARIEALGAFVRSGLIRVRAGIVYLGGVVALVLETGYRLIRAVRGGADRIRLEALVAQAVRFGVRSIPIVVLIHAVMGVILALNLKPTLELYGQVERVADVIAIAVLRELGPLITAVILSGYAGASIAAELGAMVEGEEIKALRAHALDPIRFLVAPRIVTTTVMMVGLTVLADVVAVSGGLLTSVTVFGVSTQTYLDQTQWAVTHRDYLVGLAKGGVFGAIIAAVACYEGLNVRGGAEGVGRATTTTVVKSIVGLILADCVFTVVFYIVGW